MKPLPLPLRVAAGLAMTVVEHARDLPKQLLGLPVTVLSQVLQCSMRVQQQLTELAIKGDEALSTFRPVEETPSWATFDEDLQPAPSDNGRRTEPVPDQRDPWEQEERALAEDHTEGEFDSTAATADEVAESTPEAVLAPVGLANYDELTLPQLRARLRRFSLAELEELLAYERTHANRPSFVGMLTRRIGNVQRLSEGSTDNGSQ
ncbi:lipid droplet-associated protein [Amycolatopsis taiwanensis]|nr:lipid droplet-associated protein [Amycolatopsis taiwanensis]